jgi:hypothetical protein
MARRHESKSHLLEEAFMNSNKASISEEFFPDGRYFEYYLQKIRVILADETPIFEVVEVREGPEAKSTLAPNLGPLPSVEVVTRLPGLRLRNPATGQLLISRRRISEIFESPPIQKLVLKGIAQYISESIPTESPEAGLRRKFQSVGEGAPGRLPPRADLKLIYERLVQQVGIAKKILCALPHRRHQGFDESDAKRFYEAMEKLYCDLHTGRWAWLGLIASHKLDLEQLAKGSPQATAILILQERYAVEGESLRSRLFRKE